MRPFKKLGIYYRILKAMLILRLLEKCTHPEFIRVMTYGQFEAARGDLAILEHGECEVGKVEATEGKTILIRIFRRPNGK